MWRMDLADAIVEILCFDMEPFDGRAVTGGKGRVWAVKGRWGARII
jgi:hypothetical protein